MTELETWQNVISIVDSDMEQQVTDKAISYLVKTASGLPKALSELRGMNIADLKETASYVLKKSASVQNFEKTAKEESQRKNANSSFLGRTMPFIGPVINGITGIKNCYYGFYYFRDAMKFAQQVGLSWSDTLEPEKISNCVERYRNNPKALIVLSNITKNANAFVVEGLNLVVNGIDSVKDILFIFVDVLSFGGAGFIDFGISVLLWVMEGNFESRWEASYHPILEKIKSIAQTKIDAIEAPPTSKSEFDADSWWASLTS